MRDACFWSVCNFLIISVRVFMTMSGSLTNSRSLLLACDDESDGAVSADALVQTIDLVISFSGAQCSSCVCTLDLENLSLA